MKSWLFEEINQTTRQIKKTNLKRREKLSISGMEERIITIVPKGIKRIIEKYYK